ncbi:MAG: sulfatase [Opitutia bacterium Tous-C5TDCM]|nr:MAG: sulfatase [Opitutae bacterium Tous-C5TDCM]
MTLTHLARKGFTFLAALVLGGSAAAAERTNIVLIISDDQAWTDYGFMKHPLAKTPNIDRLASEGLCFPRGYVPTSVCCPSLATIITGKMPHVHKITGNDPAAPADMARGKFYQSPAFKNGREVMNANLAKHPLLPGVLGEKGYLSLQTGKWWQGHFSNGGFTHGMTKGGRHGDDGLTIGRKDMKPISDFIDEARKQEKPFFVWYAPLLPHDPHTPPERLLAKYRDKVPSIHIARYLAMVEWFDESVGELLKMLDDRGLTKNTLVAYVADNGWIQNPDTPRFAPRSKLSQYDGGLRTQILLRQPGTIEARRDETPVSSSDLFPTILHAAGIEPGKDLPGVDLTRKEAVAARKDVFGEIYTHDLADLNDPAKSLRFRWMVRDGWKIIVPYAANEPDAVVELYQVSTDEHEKTNLAGKEAERVKAMTTVLDAWWKP